MIRRLRGMLKKVPFESRNADLNDTVLEAIGFLTALTDGNEIVLKFTPAATDLPVRGDVVQLQQVVLNLIMNAKDAMSGARGAKNEILVTTSRDGDHAAIRIGDTGPGIPTGDLKNVFDPFFTTKPHGMGMGLAIVRTIVEAHHGHVSAENQASGGALFTIRLPMARGRSPSA
jgi:signal transduction histidine kinase